MSGLPACIFETCVWYGQTTHLSRPDRCHVVTRRIPVGLAPLAAVAAKAGSKEAFVARAVATLRKSYLQTT